VVQEELSSFDCLDLLNLISGNYQVWCQVLKADLWG